MAHALQNLNNRFTLLVADDDPIIRDAIDLILRSYGYRMLFAKDGGEAISMVESERVDLAIVDLLMPEVERIRFHHALPARQSPRQHADHRHDCSH